MRVSSPPFRSPCFFGTDVDSRENLIACRLHSVKEIAAEIGADSLAYLSVDADRRLGGESARFCCDGCFTGHYPIDIPEDQGKSVQELYEDRTGEKFDIAEHSDDIKRYLKNLLQ